MKHFVIPALAALVLVACSAPVKNVHPDWTYSSVVYEVNVRQFSPEGTLKAVEAQLPRLKDLGVDILWLMPINKIGVEGRKGTLGSYYAIADYKAIDPEFGTIADFDDLIAAAHEQGFKIIMDWVANQTAPDNVWMTEKPADFYERDSLGNAIWEYDWTDTRSLNYENREVWYAQEDAMRFWLERGVDGFRCDAAGEMPSETWQYLVPTLRRDYPEIYLLAEAEKTEFAVDTMFDATYAWELHHIENGIGNGPGNKDAVKTVADLKDYLKRDAARVPRSAFRLAFTSNHDENSWAGTEFERMGDAWQVLEVLNFTLPQTQPLIYTGQEIGLSRRLEFFEKDAITDWSANEYTEFYKYLTDLKHANPALDAGERGGRMKYIPGLPENVLGFTRAVKGNKVTVLANLSAEPVVAKGHELEPWGWLVEVAGD
ncbi:MAG: alpha-amylase [Bacteroidales bacterium]|nr:alpha-amylase [Bacteroidales bacterium]